MTRVKPLLFGYQVVRLNTTELDLDFGRRLMQAYADREGFAMGSVFVERDLTCSAMSALIAAVRQVDEAAIVVVSASDLGSLQRVQYLTRKRLESESNARVLIVEKIL